MHCSFSQTLNSSSAEVCFKDNTLADVHQTFFPNVPKRPVVSLRKSIFDKLYCRLLISSCCVITYHDNRCTVADTNYHYIFRRRQLQFQKPFPHNVLLPNLGVNTIFSTHWLEQQFYDCSVNTI